MKPYPHMVQTAVPFPSKPIHCRCLHGEHGKRLCRTSVQHSSLFKLPVHRPGCISPIGIYARSLWDAIHWFSTTFAEKRVEISIATLRQQCRLLRWVPTEQQLADVLTKRSKSLRDAFRKWMSDPWVTLVESRPPTDIRHRQKLDDRDLAECRRISAINHLGLPVGLGGQG